MTFPGCFYVLCKYNSFQFSEYLLLSNNNTTTGRVDNRLIFQISLIFISYISLSTFIHLIIYLQHVTGHIKSIQSRFYYICSKHILQSYKRHIIKSIIYYIYIFIYYVTFLLYFLFHDETFSFLKMCLVLLL